LEAALRSPTSYVALVASPRRATVMRDYLAGRGVTPEQLDKLHAPAGLNLGAETPEEIALSILAEVVQRRSTLPLTAPVEIWRWRMPGSALTMTRRPTTSVAPSANPGSRPIRRCSPA
jgi:hypothetical protein